MHGEITTLPSSSSFPPHPPPFNIPRWCIARAVIVDSIGCFGDRRAELLQHCEPAQPTSLYPGDLFVLGQDQVAGQLLF